MPATSAIEVYVDAETKRLARATGRSRSHVAAKVVSAYVARELDIVEGIQRALDDVHAGRVISHGRPWLRPTQ